MFMIGVLERCAVAKRGSGWRGAGPGHDLRICVFFMCTIVDAPSALASLTGRGDVHLDTRCLE